LLLQELKAHLDKGIALLESHHGDEITFPGGGQGAMDGTLAVHVPLAFVRLSEGYVCCEANNRKEIERVQSSLILQCRDVAGASAVWKKCREHCIQSKSAELTVQMLMNYVMYKCGFLNEISVREATIIRERTKFYHYSKGFGETALGLAKLLERQQNANKHATRPICSTGSIEDDLEEVLEGIQGMRMIHSNGGDINLAPLLAQGLYLAGKYDKGRHQGSVACT
jgi:hypothetical protein